MDIQQFQSAFRSKTKWNYIFEATNFDFLSVRGTAVSVGSFATVIWSRRAMALSPTANRGRCVTRPTNGCEGDYSKRGTGAFHFCSKVFGQFPKKILRKFIKIASSLSPNAIFSFF